MFENLEIKKFNLIDNLNLSCTFDNVYLVLKNFAVNTYIEIIDDNLEDFVYYKGTIKNYLDSINSYNNFYVMNCSIENNILVLRVINNFLGGN